MAKKIICAIGIIILMLTVICTLASCECKHDWSEGTCTYDGRCNKCGETVGSGYGHEFNEWEEIKKAKIDEDGEKERVCSKCGEKESLTVSLIDILREKGENELKLLHTRNKSQLLNPNSYTVNSDYGQIFYDEETDNIYLMISVDYSAQNQVGGYTRYQDKHCYYWTKSSNGGYNWFGIRDQKLCDDIMMYRFKEVSGF